MAAETDQFVIATFALWAGDFAYFERLVNEFSPPHHTPQIGDDVETPTDFIRATGARRLRQLWQKRGEFKRLTENLEITDRAEVIESEHLRGTIWRIEEREFLMQAYLKDLSWAESLFNLARLNARSPDSQKEIRSPNLHPELEWKTADDEAYHSPGSSWIVIGNPFIRVQLTEMGLVDARALWVERLLPMQAAEVIRPFSNVLASLDSVTKSGIGNEITE
jgi:hypothetical protein